MKVDRGIVRVRKMNANAKLLVRGIARTARHDLAAAQATVLLAHNKCLVKIGLAMSIPPDCYGRIAPRSGLALKNFIDLGQV